MVFGIDQKLLFSRFQAFAVTLSGLASGEYLPLPRSKGGAFPYLLTLDGGPTATPTSLENKSFCPFTGKRGFSCHPIIGQQSGAMNAIS